MMTKWYKTKTFRIVIAVFVVAAVILVASLAVTKNLPFEGKFEKVPVVRVEGKLLVAKLACMDGCKWLWAIEVNKAEIMRAENYITIAPPETGETLALEISDSKANLHVNSTPTGQFTTGAMTVYEYSLLENVNNVIVYYTEEVGSSGLPELYGAVY